MSNYLFMFKADESLIDVPRWLNGPDEERSFLKIPGIGVEFAHRETGERGFVNRQRRSSSVGVSIMTRRASISKEVNRLLRIGIKRVHGFTSRMRAVGSQSCMTCSANSQS